MERFWKFTWHYGITLFLLWQSMGKPADIGPVYVACAVMSVITVQAWDIRREIREGRGDGEPPR